MDKHYTITGRKGIYIAGTDRTAIIGQTDGCDMKVINHTPYADEIFAKIVPNREGDGWHLVKVTRHWPISVNGVEINRVHYLNDGDVLDFPNANCRFNIVEGRQDSPAVVHIHKRNGMLLWGIVAAIAVIAAVVGYRIYDTSRENITSAMLAEIEASLFTTRVDSLQLICGDSVAGSYSYASGPTGTAFLTSDSLIVTARHCLQPWLNMVVPHDYAKIPDIREWPVEMALFAETRNQLADSATYRIRSFLTLTDEQGVSFPISSDRFAINYDSDEIVELGSYSTPQYWRSISHRYSRSDMMLGDIAVAKHSEAGRIPLASHDDLPRLLAHKGTRLDFFGHPESGVSGNRLDRQTDELRLPISALETDSTRIFMLAHGGALTPGFSGGPVIVRDGLGFKAVGVISVVDEKNGNRSYSVPTSEIKFLHP